VGGAKRKSMAQMEKTQQQQDTKGDAGGQGKKPKSGGKGPGDKRPRGLNYPEVSDPKILGEVRRMPAITPYAVASQFNLRLSIAKDLLEELEKRSIVKLVGGNSRVRIYQPANAPSAVPATS
jgi:small subunit ribosomal protein S25e